jgi:hypothetical protein
MLDDNGIVDLELEDIPHWWDDGPACGSSRPPGTTRPVW